MMRRRRLVLACVLVLLVAVGGAGWYALAEERRLARLVGRVVSSRLGLAVTVDRAATDGRSLSLTGVRVVPGPGFPVDLRIRRLEIAGGVLPLVAPAGRRLDVTATSASVRLSSSGAGPVDERGVESLRTSVRALLDWPGALTVRVANGELVTAGASRRFGLRAEKTAGAATVALAVDGDDGAIAGLRVDARLAAGADGAVDIAMDVAAAPPRLGALWPAAWRPATLAARGDVRLSRGGDGTVSARLTAGAAADPVVIDLAARYDAVRTALDVSRYTVRWGPALAVAGTARLQTAGGTRLEATGGGSVDGGRLEGRAAYLADGGFEADVTLAPVDAAQLGRRLGVSLPDARAARVRVRAEGTVGAAGVRSVVDVAATAVTAAAAPAAPVDAVARAALGAGGRVEQAAVTVSHRGTPVAVVTAASRGASPLPLALDAAVDDLGRLAPLLPGAPVLAGTARVTGELAERGPARTFAGRLEARLDRGEWTAPAPVTVSGVRAVLPVSWSGGALARGDAPGTLTAARVATWGAALTDVTAALVIEAGGVTLPDLRYRHYGGQGGGRVDLSPATGVTARLGGTGVDLGALVRELGTTAARVTGRVDYTLTARVPDAAHGLDGEMRLGSEPGGGEIGIDAIQRLIAWAPVEGDTFGILRRTLENLKVFAYDSLAGDLRWTRGAGRLDLFLRGKKRLGLFPAPVEAINIKNVPLAVLAGTVTRGPTP